ncbi:MAG: FtsW/RodA/SpoVE family cell cycle protein, partial [Solirubrobacterales bacterium]|nr:FtsW/RodA/SpoVE family cell cycle protein [Solirubrobacterales bacterium]
MTSTPTSRPAASISGRSWSAPDGAGCRGALARPNRRARRVGGEHKPGPYAATLSPGRPTARPAARAPHPDDGHALPAGVRGGDGLQRVLAIGRSLTGRQRHRAVRSVSGVRRRRPGRDARARAPGLEIFTPRLVTVLLLGSFALLLLVLVPGFGVAVYGARRWFSAGPIQFQPSELMKLALVLYAARYLADHPKRMRSFRQAVAPIAVVAGPACLLIVVEPDLGTTLVVAFTMAALLIAAGMPMRYVAALAGIVAVCVILLATAQPYQRARLTSFLHPWATAAKSGPSYQAVQGQIALGSGGLFGVGLGRSVQKIFYLPEAQTDFILAVIGE